MGVKAHPAAIPGQQLSSDEQRRLDVDGNVPTALLQPRDAAEAALALKQCDNDRAAVIIWGGGTQMALGSPPRAYEAALSTERMTELLEYEPADLTCRVQAGVRLQDLQRTLGEQGQRLPLDPPRPERATVGGMVASNASGLSRGRHGTVRDWVIGMAVAYPSGKVARAGGKVVKNVAGYDLMKLHIGALGTLGVVAEVNLKVQALPQAASTVLARFEMPAPPVRAGLLLAREYLAPAASIVLDRGALSRCGINEAWPWALALKLEGYQKEVERGRALAGQAVREAGGSVEAIDIPPGFWEEAGNWSAAAADAVVLRAIGPVSQLQSILAALPQPEGVMLQPASGIVELRVSLETAVTALQHMRSLLPQDWQVIVASAPAQLKRSLDVWGPPPPGFALMRGLKAALDPNGILNPGRFVGGL